MRSGWVACAVVLLAWGCAAPAPTPAPSTSTGAEYVDPGAELSRLRFLERDQVSMNDRCPVRHSRLNPEIAPVYVNGRPLGFC